jgi:WD40 repeat protein
MFFNYKTRLGCGFFLLFMVSDVTSEEEKKALRLGDYRLHVNCLAFSPDKKLLVSGGPGPQAEGPGNLILWNVANGSANRIIKRHRRAIKTVEFSPTGNLIAAAGEDGEAKLWESTSGEVRRDLLGHTRTVDSICFSKDGKLVATCARDHTVKTWKMSTGGELASFKIDFPAENNRSDPEGIYRVSLSSDGQYIVVATSFPALINIHIPTRKKSMIPHEGSPAIAHFSGDGKSIVSLSAWWQGKETGGKVFFWDWRTRKQTGCLPVSRGDAAISKDGKRLVTATRIEKKPVTKPRIQIWDLERKKEIRSIENSNFLVISCLALSDDGKILAIAGETENELSAEIQLWDVETGKNITP